MPVVILAPQDEMLDKFEVEYGRKFRHRGGELFVFADEDSGIHGKDRQHVVHIPAVNEWLAPIVYSIPVQLTVLSMNLCSLRGTDVDQPRNLSQECDCRIKCKVEEEFVCLQYSLTPNNKVSY